MKRLERQPGEDPLPLVLGELWEAESGNPETDGPAAAPDSLPEASDDEDEGDGGAPLKPDAE